MVNEVKYDAPITAREFSVIHLVAEGKQNKVIARALGISEYTVKAHVHTIFKKLKIHNRTSLAIWYWDRQKVAS